MVQNAGFYAANGGAISRIAKNAVFIFGNMVVQIWSECDAPCDKDAEASHGCRRKFDAPTTLI
jgi:hypothetical protein